ncbi:MAG TPA: FAD-dependent oxidoreductase [Chloroflexi bacterium]|nr:FAD-dependent oxidoreductase [Chloroflexota bacterium]
MHLPVFDSADVVVLGAGSAGCTAAIAAARAGADTLLVERYGFLGGASTMVLDSFYGFYIPGNDARRVVGGIPWEIVERLRRYGMVIERPSSYGAGQAVTYDPPTLQVVWEQTALEAGVRLRLHTFCLDVQKEGDRVTGIVVGGKSGMGLITGKVFVDTSGDADLCFRAGAPFQPAGEDGPAQSLTTTFRLGNVDEERALKVKRADLVQMMKEANLSGDYRLPREEGSVHRTPLRGVVATNMTRVAYVDGTDPVELTKAEVEGRRQAMEYVRFLRERIPGYEQAYLINFSTQIGIRETRRVYGDYRLTREDVLSARHFPDAIAQCGAPIEDHHPGSDTRWEYLPAGATYDIPLRSLIPQTVANVLTAGRCLSATHDAHASVRSMGQCMAMGQAAGTAAALALQVDNSVRGVSVPHLQQQLRSAGALFSGAG